MNFYCCKCRKKMRTTVRKYKSTVRLDEFIAYEATGKWRRFGIFWMVVVVSDWWKMDGDCLRSSWDGGGSLGMDLRCGEKQDDC